MEGNKFSDFIVWKNKKDMIKHLEEWIKGIKESDVEWYSYLTVLHIYEITKENIEDCKTGKDRSLSCQEPLHDSALHDAHCILLFYTGQTGRKEKVCLSRK